MATVPTVQGTRTPLSRQRILETAAELADEGGIESLTMRRLGQALGVEAMSLYNHVEDKDDILAGIVGLVLSEIVFSPPSLDWKRSLRESAISAHDALIARPWSCELILSPTSTRVAVERMHYIESILARLRFAGFSPAAASRGYHALDSHILGFTLWELGHRLPRDTPPDYVENLIAQLDVETFPYLIEHADEHMHPTAVEKIGEFEFGLELILDGLERYVTPEAPPT
jgi:AcrR family transcriptional regulator